MIAKAEAEEAVRKLATDWASETAYLARPGFYPSFADFRAWLDRKGYDHYLGFRSSVDPLIVAEGWFEIEIERWGRTARQRAASRDAALNAAMQDLTRLRGEVRQAEKLGRGSRIMLELAGTVSRDLREAGADPQHVNEAWRLAERAMQFGVN